MHTADETCERKWEKIEIEEETLSPPNHSKWQTKITNYDFQRVWEMLSCVRESVCVFMPNVFAIVIENGNGEVLNLNAMSRTRSQSEFLALSS